MRPGALWTVLTLAACTAITGQPDPHETVSCGSDARRCEAACVDGADYPVTGGQCTASDGQNCGRSVYWEDQRGCCTIQLTDQSRRWHSCD